MRTIFFEVVPRTSESSIRMMRLPSIAARLALCFMLHAEFADRLGRLDEGAADIVVADDAELERHAGMLGIADRGGHAGIRHRHDDVDVDMALARELRAEGLAHVIDRAAVTMKSGREK